MAALRAPDAAPRAARPAALAPLLAALLAASALAGCSAPETPATIPPPDPTGAYAHGSVHAHGPAPASSSAPTPDAMDIEGIVQTTRFDPIAGAAVAVRGTDRNVTSGADGRFSILGLRPAVYLLDVHAAGHRPATLRVEPAAHAALDVQLQAVAAPEARAETARFRGHFQCALEAAIISGSCDAVLTSDSTAGMDPVFQGNATFDVEAGPGWRTVVVDVVFDATGHPGVAGLRVTAKGLRDQGGLGEYEQYGRFFGAEPFTFRLDPGATYEEGETAVPVNATQFRFEAYPHSHGWHAACSPDGQCLLGAGAALDLDFEMYVTTFYGEPAPADWTLREPAP